RPGGGMNRPVVKPWHRLASILLATVAAWGLPGPASGQDVVGLSDAVRREVRDARRLPGGRYMEARAWEAEGPPAGDQIGRAVSDPAAIGKRAWETRVGRDTPSSHALYGPYIDLNPGDYVALFRIKLLDEAGEEAVGVIDVAANFGQEILATRDLAGS